jgi:hypothetical protein
MPLGVISCGIADPTEESFEPAASLGEVIRSRVLRIFLRLLLVVEVYFWSFTFKVFFPPSYLNLQSL